MYNNWAYLIDFILNLNVTYFRISTLQSSSEDNPDTSDINLLQHLDIDLSRLLTVMGGKSIGTYCADSRCIWGLGLLFLRGHNHKSGRPV